MFIKPSQVDYPEHYQHIFLLSHMRANTSLISHILGSHAQISGYYEMHLSYCSAEDLVRQQQMYLTNDSIEKNTKYLFDKLLHNDYKLYLDHLGAGNPQVLVSIRSAEQTIKSIVNVFRIIFFIIAPFLVLFSIFGLNLSKILLWNVCPSSSKMPLENSFEKNDDNKKNKKAEKAEKIEEIENLLDLKESAKKVSAKSTKAKKAPAKKASAKKKPAAKKAAAKKPAKKAAKKKR